MLAESDMPSTDASNSPCSNNYFPTKISRWYQWSLMSLVMNLCFHMPTEIVPLALEHIAKVI